MPGKNAISIRLATDSDWIEIERLIFSLFPHATPSNTEKDVFFLAEDGKTFVGFAHVRILPSSLLLQGFGVLPSARKKGVGKLLLDFAARWCENEFPEKPLKLEVASGNSAAISLYLKEGFMLSKDDGGAYRLVKAKPT